MGHDSPRTTAIDLTFTDVHIPDEFERKYLRDRKPPSRAKASCGKLSMATGMAKTVPKLFDPLPGPLHSSMATLSMGISQWARRISDRRRSSPRNVWEHYIFTSP